MPFTNRRTVKLSIDHLGKATKRDAIQIITMKKKKEINDRSKHTSIDRYCQ